LRASPEQYEPPSKRTDVVARLIDYRVNESRLYWYMVSTVLSLRSMKYIREASAATGL